MAPAFESLTKAPPRRFLLSALFPLRSKTAEREGFEPSDRFPGQQLSRLLHSTALPPLLYVFICRTLYLALFMYDIRQYIKEWRLWVSLLFTD